MKNSFHLTFILSLLIFGCQESSSLKQKHSSVKIEALDKEKLNKEQFFKGSIDCDLNFDTIGHPDYIMHHRILAKFNDPEKRSFYFSTEGDTLNHFLNHQDIAEFTGSLNPNEQGIYKLYTNKIVFLILEQEPVMLDIGLTGWLSDLSYLDYFFEHIKHPLCNSIPVDSIHTIISNEMREQRAIAKTVKQTILENRSITVN